MNKKKWTDENVLEYIRALAEKLGRTPRTKDIAKYVERLAYERFGSWKNALMLAIGKHPVKYEYSKDEYPNLLKRIADEKQRLPTKSDVPETVRASINKEYGSFHDLSESVFGRSYRSELLRALSALTPPQCPSASTYEVCMEVNRYGLPLTNKGTSIHMNELQELGYVEGGKSERIALWRLTVKGKQFVTKFRSKVAGSRL